MKRNLALFCVLALLLGMVIPGTTYASADTTCPCCGAANVQWQTVTADNFNADVDLLPGGHYRLGGDVNYRHTIATEGTYCIDLAGYTLTGTNKVFNLGAKASAGAPAVTLNVMDSSKDQTGKIEGRGGSGNSGGLIYVFANATFNLYGGTIQPNTTGVVAYSGGIFAVYGTLNMYGGKLIGGKLGGTSSYPHVGGTVCVQAGGVANFYGGNVVSGTAESKELGDCVYVKKDGEARLSGAAQVEEIAFDEAAVGNLTVSGVYTGSAKLRLPGEIASGTVVAVSDNADISGGSITVVDTNLGATLVGNSILVGEESWCEACQKNVIWQNLSDTLPVATSGHYRLVNHVNTSQASMKTGNRICLDLNGFSYNGSGRTLVVGSGNNTPNGEVLNIMDSSAAKTGRITGHGGGGSMAGGVIYNYKNTTVNIYGGTIEALGSGKVIAKNGGALDTYGTINMYGGTVIGNHVGNYGGTVCLLSSTAVFNMAGGTLVAGLADNQGDCVHVAAGATIKISGDAVLPGIYMADAAASKLIVFGNYTGKAELQYATTPAPGAVVGDCSNATLGKENIRISGTRLHAVPSGNALVVQQLTGASVTGENTVYYDSLEAALSAAVSGNTVKLLADAEEATVPEGIILDLNGWSLNRLSAAGTVYVKDSATDDYRVEDTEGYGVIAETAAGTVQPCENYLALAEATGISFHKYILQLTKVNLRPGEAGIYYGSDILVNERILENLDRYGIAVSTNSTVPTADPGDANSLYTAFGQKDYGVSDTGSVLIRGIMDGENTDAADAAIMIYGCPYILLKNGTYLYGDIYSTNLQQLTETISKKLWDKLTLAQNRALMGMYDTYSTVMAGWNATNIIQSAAKKQAAAEDGVLKAILIGNSASTDATRLLAAIFQAEAPEQEFVLGCMYESGCPIKDHVTYYEKESPVYTYYRNTGDNEYGAWDSIEKATLKQGLADQNWDIVIFQELHTVSGLLTTFTSNNNLETLISYVVDTLGYEPQLDWHSVGIIPEIPQPYVDYVMSLESDGNDDTEAGENENWEDTGVSEPEDLAWIFDIARPLNAVGWARNYIKNFNNDAQTMYDAICDVAENYIMPNEAYGFTDVVPGGSAIQYARNMGMTDRDLFRDYAHKSDYGRVIIGYTWYASLMDITELSELKYTTVPAPMRQKKFVHLGDLVLDERQYQIALDAVNYALANPFDSPEPITTN